MNFVTAPRFIVDCPALSGGLGFSELTGITSKVPPTEMPTCDAKGRVVYYKAFGKNEAATVKLKRGFDQDGMMKLLAWHSAARNGLTNLKQDVHLEVFDKGKDPESDTADAEYKLENAWLSEINVSPMKAGDSAVATIEITIVCEFIDTVPSSMMAG